MLCVCVFVLKARIKKIMQVDEDVGKVAAAVPVIICIFSSVASTCVSLSLILSVSVSLCSVSCQ